MTERLDIDSRNEQEILFITVSKPPMGHTLTSVESLPGAISYIQQVVVSHCLRNIGLEQWYSTWGKNNFKIYILL
jgi:hypothetical protein